MSSQGNIYLIGFMGCGKTTVAKAVSRIYGLPFIDLDEEIRRSQNMTIDQIFRLYQEAGFRKIELETLHLAAKRSFCVVATGGGLPLNGDAMDIMRSGKTFFLDASLSTITARMTKRQAAQRPLWQNPEAVAQLFRQRQDIYRKADFTVDANKSPEELAQEIMSLYIPSAKQTFCIGNQNSTIISSIDAISSIRETLQEESAKGVSGRIFLMDSNVSKIHGQRFRDAFPDARQIVFPAGEKSKSLKCAAAIYQQLNEAKTDRKAVLIAVGGGVTTDIGGFIAATYKRGIRCIFVPTTMLASVDAAIGGKNGLDTPECKNSIGTFHPPLAVIQDFSLLMTLHPKQLLDGFIEAYKTGIIFDHGLACLMEQALTSSRLPRNIALLAFICRKCAEIKSQVVQKDFKEQNLRMGLNFGHTYGHAVESFNKYRYSHGKCVAVGMIAALEIARKRKLLPNELIDRPIATIRKIIGHTIPIAKILPPAGIAWELMANDKKAEYGTVRFILPTEKSFSVASNITQSEMNEITGLIK